MQERDAALTRRSEDLLLLNNLASTLTSSLEQDEILDKTSRRCFELRESRGR